MASSSYSAENTGAESSPVSVSAQGDTSIDKGLVPSMPDSQILSPPLQAAKAVVPSASSSATPEASLGDEPKDKDKSSLSTTLTGTITRTSRRKVNKSSTFENAPSSSTHVEKPAAIGRSSSSKAKAKVYNSTRSSKPSFFLRLVRKLVPCTGTSRAHTVDVDDAASELGSSVVLKEKQGLKDIEKDSGPSQLSKATTDTDPAPSPADTSSSLPLATCNPLAIIPLPPPADSDVFIPSTKQLLPESETEGVTSGAVQPPGSTGEDILHDHTMQTHTSGDETDGTGATGDEEYEDANNMEDMEDEEDRLIRQGGAGIPIGPDGEPRPLLPPIAPQHVGRKCLVLDLDETLVHSSFKSIQQADYIVPVEIDHHWHNFYELKRPGVDDFLKEMGLIYEVVVFTASLSVYADPVLDKLDIHQAVTHRLFRESCYNHKGNYVKDLSQLGRPMTDTIILDNSPASYIFHPNNAVPVSSWFNDPHDTELTDMCPFLADLQTTADVRGVLDAGV